MTSERIQQYGGDDPRPRCGFPCPWTKSSSGFWTCRSPGMKSRSEKARWSSADWWSEKKTIVLNEKHLKLFEEKPGLKRSTLGHEAAHWDLEHRANSQTPSLFDEEPEDEVRIDKRKTTRSGELLDILIDLACRNYRAYKLFKELTEGQDTPEQKSAMDRYRGLLC